MPNNRPCANCSATGAVKRCAFCGVVRYCSKGCQKKHYPRHKEKCQAAGDSRLAFPEAHDTQAVFEQRMERYTAERHNTVDMIPQLRRKLAKAAERHGEDSEEVLQARTRLRLALSNATDQHAEEAVDPATKQSTCAIVRYQEEMTALTRQTTDSLTRRHGALHALVFGLKDQLASELFMLSTLDVGMRSTEAHTESMMTSHEILNTLPSGGEPWIVQIRGKAKLNLGCNCLTKNDVEAGKHLVREAIEDIRSVYGDNGLLTKAAFEQVASHCSLHGVNVPMYLTTSM